MRLCLGWNIALRLLVRHRSVAFDIVSGERLSSQNRQEGVGGSEQHGDGGSYTFVDLSFVSVVGFAFFYHPREGILFSSQDLALDRPPPIFRQKRSAVTRLAAKE